jgi:precorrin-6B methylase 2
MQDIERWELNNGAIFLKNIGIKNGQKVLDFGARTGHYTIPLARLVGRAGKIFALDKDRQALEKLERKASKQGLENIILLRTDGGCVPRSVEINKGVSFR